MEEQSPSPQPYETPPKKQKNPLSRAAKLILAAILIWWFSNYTLKVTKVEIKSQKLKNEVRIAVLSDMHALDSRLSIKNETIIKKVLKINPDFVCVLGDMHSLHASDKEKQISMDLMTGIINEGFKLYFVLGEHDDRTNGYVSQMIKNGINVLDDQSVKIKVRESEVTLYGISNAYFSPSFDLNNEFDIKKKNFNILMAHIPMYSDYEKFGADLTLCGDTHGGVVRLPSIGPVYFDGKFFPKLIGDPDSVFDKGLFGYEGGCMFITSGIGNTVKNTNLPVRFFNRPEIASVTISPD